LNAFATFDRVTQRDTLEKSLPVAERLRAIRAAVANELRLLDELLARVSSPALTRTITMARRELTEIEPSLLEHVADSPDPDTLLSGAELYLARISAARELAQEDPNVTMAG
jgi:glutamine synthetase adenylyltransferase